MIQILRMISKMGNAIDLGSIDCEFDSHITQKNVLYQTILCNNKKIKTDSVENIYFEINTATYREGVPNIFD